MRPSLTRAVLWDSSAILASLDRRDENHQRALRVSERLASERWFSFVTNYIQSEAHALLLRWLGRGPAREWLLEGGMEVFWVSPDEEARAREIIGRHQDKDWSLCDAISFAVMESRAVGAAFSFDRHFRQFGRFQVFGG